MSYDVSLVSGDLSFEIGNYTYNCAGMFYQGTDTGLNQLDGMKASEAYPILKQRFEYMRDNPEEMRQYEPDNGWGNYEGFLDFIGRITVACRKNPNATLDVS